MKNTFILIIISLFSSCSRAQCYAPCDRQATTETRELYYSMQRLIGAGVLFGHHDDTGYGVKWKYDANSSDVKSVTGTYPAVYGWDLAKLEHDSTLDINKFPFAVQRKRVKEAYERGVH